MLINNIFSSHWEKMEFSRYYVSSKTYLLLQFSRLWKHSLGDRVDFMTLDLVPKASAQDRIEFFADSEICKFECSLFEYKNLSFER